MKKSLIFALGILVIIAGVAWFLFAKNKPENISLTPIRIGWQVAWVPQAELAMVMQHTDVLNQNGLQPEFAKFTYGAPLAEAALAGEVDVIFVGQVPAMSLITKSDDWMIVGRLLDGRGAIIVPKGSSIATVADLKGKTFALPFGTLNHIFGLDDLKIAGLDPTKDLKFQHIDAAEAANVVQKGTTQSWGEINATSLWDPNVAMLEEHGKAKTIREFRLDGVVVMSKKFYESNPEAATAFMKSMLQSYDFYLNDKDMVNDWYVNDTGITYSRAVLEKAASLERNNNAKNLREVSMILAQEDLDRIQDEANKGFTVDVLKKQLKVQDIINLSFVQNAENEIDKGNYPENISIVQQ